METNKALTAITAAVLGLLLTATATAACNNGRPTIESEAKALGLEQCAYEDSVNCWWNASERGNGTGADFLTLQTGRGLTVYYSANGTLEQYLCYTDGACTQPWELSYSSFLDYVDFSHTYGELSNGRSDR